MPNSKSTGEQLTREWKNYYIAFVCKDEQTMRGNKYQGNLSHPKVCPKPKQWPATTEEFSMHGVKNRTTVVSKTSNTAKILTGLIQAPLVVE